MGEAPPLLGGVERRPTLNSEADTSRAPSPSTSTDTFNASPSNSPPVNGNRAATYGGKNREAISSSPDRKPPKRSRLASAASKAVENGSRKEAKGGGASLSVPIPADEPSFPTGLGADSPGLMGDSPSASLGLGMRRTLSGLVAGLDVCITESATSDIITIDCPGLGLGLSPALGPAGSLVSVPSLSGLGFSPALGPAAAPRLSDVTMLGDISV